MTDVQRPFPQPDDVTQPFWEGIEAGELRLQRCRGCSRYVFFPRAVCPHCMNADLEWVVASGTGTIYAVTVVHRAPPGFDDSPYAVALVELAEGVRMMARIVDADPADVAIDQPVEVAIQGDPRLPYFRLADA